MTSHTSAPCISLTVTSTDTTFGERLNFPGGAATPLVLSARPFFESSKKCTEVLSQVLYKWNSTL